MPRTRFTPRTTIVMVAVELTNRAARRSVIVNMLLDTGATYTAIPMRVATGLGVAVDPARTVRILTAKGSFETVPLVRLDRIQVLGLGSDDVEALIINLPLLARD